VLPNARPYVDLPPPTPESTLQAMHYLAVQAQHDLQMRELAERIVGGLWPNDYVSEYAALLNWVRRHIRYVRDPAIVEQVKTPRATLETRCGDCDDMAVLLSALVGHLGGQSRYVAGAFKAYQGRPILSHVWCEAKDPTSGAWVALDPVPGRRVGQMLGRTIKRIKHNVM
jgi:transglutaminase-like putative cysteine protease